MNLTSKSRYALKIMMDLAHHRELPLVRRAEIARRQGIPPDYLDQIMIRLRAGDLVESVRGRSGGYRLQRDANQITLWDIFGTVEDGIYPVECLETGHTCDFEPGCLTFPVWQEIFEAIKGPLSKINLLDVTQRNAQDARMCPIGGVRECNSGTSPAAKKAAAAKKSQAAIRAKDDAGAAKVSK